MPATPVPRAAAAAAAAADSPLPASSASSQLAAQTLALHSSLFPDLGASSDASALLAKLDARAEALQAELGDALSSQLPGGFQGFAVAGQGLADALDGLRRDVQEASRALGGPAGPAAALALHEQERAAQQARLQRLRELCDTLRAMAELQQLFEEFDLDMDEARVRACAGRLEAMDALCRRLAEEPPVVARPARALTMRRRAALQARLEELVASSVAFSPGSLRVGFDASSPSLARAVRLEEVVAACGLAHRALLDKVCVQDLCSAVLGPLVAEGGWSVEERVTDTESCLKLVPRPGPAALGEALDAVFRALRFVWSRVFDERGLDLVPGLWPRLEGLLLDRLRRAVPESWEGMEVFAGLGERVRAFEDSVAEFGLHGAGGERALSDVVVNAEESFAHKARVSRLSRARDLLLGEDAFNSVLVGGGDGTGAGQHQEPAPEEGGDDDDGEGLEMRAMRVSAGAFELAKLADDALLQASRSPSERYALVLVQTARDLFELFRALAPLRTRSGPRDAMLLRNDFEFLAWRLTALAHAHAFPAPLAGKVCTVDLAPGFVDAAEALYAKELAARSEEVAAAVADALQRRAQAGFAPALEALDRVAREWEAVLGGRRAPRQDLLGAAAGAVVSALCKAPPLASKLEARDMAARLARLSEALRARGGQGLPGSLLRAFEPHVSLPLFVDDFAAAWPPGTALGLAHFLFAHESSAQELREAEAKLTARAGV